MLADPPSLPLVDHLEGDLRLGRVGVAYEPGDADGTPGLLVDGDDGLAAATADVDEPVHVTLEQAWLRAEEAQSPRALGQTGEDLEHRSAFTGAKRSIGQGGHVGHDA